MSLSSDAPVERWFGFEILEHEASAIDMSRAANGLPLLWNHDTDQPIGRLEDVGLREDGKLGAMLRFSRSARAQEVRQDVEDGVLTDMSIGYRVNDWLEEKRDGQLYYRATSWTPMEGSIVPVPADHTVGINRSAERAAPVVEPPAPPAPGKEQQMSETPTPVVTGGASRSEEEKLIRSAAKTFGMEREAMGWLDKGLSLEQVRAEIEQAQVAKAQAATPAGHVEMSERERNQFSIGRALVALADGHYHREASFEKEVSDDIARRLGRSTGGLFVPMNVRAAITGNTAGTASLGGATVPEIQGTLIELLRNRLIARRAGATVLTGLTGNMKWPRQITTNTATWTGENPSTETANTSMTYDTVTASPKTVHTVSAFSRQVAIQGSPDAQNQLTMDLVNVIALAVDSAYFNGTGSNNQPTGIRTASINSFTLGANGAALDFSNVVRMETEVANDNADYGTLSYVTNSRVRGKLKTTLQNTVAGAQYIWGGGPDGTINGYRALISNQLPSTLTKGTSTTICSSIVFGNFAEAILCEWGGAIELLVDQFTNAKQGMINVNAYGMFDVAIRHLESFCKVDEVLTT